MVSLATLSDFSRLFSGNTEAYGIHEYKYTDKKEKEKGKSYTKVEPIMDKLYENHLNGEQGLGVIPINGSSCRFSVLDVDIYNKDLSHITSIIYKHDFPLFPFRTKSGGLHLYLFYQEPIRAIKAINFMNSFRTILGLDRKTEVFPKQASLKSGQVGNWINLPYFNYENTKQYMIGPDEEPYLLETAMQVIMNKLQTEETLIETLSNVPLNDAPPCLQTIYLLESTDYRNNYLFSLAGYFKAKHGDDFEFKVSEANSMLQEPLPINELSKTVISAHKKKDYSYKCNEDPICALCDKAICKTRTFGIGGDEVSQLSYEDLIQYKTDPPYYEWMVNGKSLKFYSELDIIMQQKFRTLCFRELHILPHRIKDVNWTKIINRALENVIVKTISVEDDISPGTLFKEYLTEFLEKRILAKTKEQIMIDRVYKDNESMCYVFRPKNLIKFLTIQKQFRYYGVIQMQAKLKELGGMPKRYYVNNRLGALRVWILPFDGLKKFIVEKNLDEFSIDFKEDYSNEPF
jgi:hypothetical protein